VPTRPRRDAQLEQVCVDLLERGRLELQKLGMRDRTELTRYDIRVGLIEP